MLNKRDLLKALSAGAVAGWRGSASAMPKNIPLYADDGSEELIPQFLLNRYAGSAQVRVKAGFNGLTSKKALHLGKKGGVFVNGTRLELGAGGEPDTYQAMIPRRNDLVFEIRRANGAHHRFATTLPWFTVAEKPSKYRFPEDFVILLGDDLVVPNYKVLRDGFSMSLIYGGSSRYAFLDREFAKIREKRVRLKVLERHKEDYQFIGETQLSRHQHNAVMEVSPDFKAGWVISVVQAEPFLVDVE